MHVSLVNLNIHRYLSVFSKPIIDVLCIVKMVTMTQSSLGIYQQLQQPSPFEKVHANKSHKTHGDIDIGVSSQPYLA